MYAYQHVKIENLLSYAKTTPKQAKIIERIKCTTRITLLNQALFYRKNVLILQ